MPDCSPDELKKAEKAVYQLIKIRVRSEKEIRQRLAKRKFSKTVIQTTIAYFKELDLINDREFTRQWIAWRLAKPFGVNRIRLELREKGIDSATIGQELEKATDGYCEVSTAVSLSRQRARKYKKIDPAKAKTRIYGYLSRRGFTPDAILRALQDYEN